MRNSYAPPVSGAELGSARVGARWAGPLTRRSWFFLLLFCMVFSFFPGFLVLLFFILVFCFFFHSFLYFSFLQF
jgi:hypothetical protein